MKKILKNDSGISGVDIVTSIGIIMIFSTIITLVYTNLTSSNVKIQRTQIATNYAVALMEKVDKLYYGELTEEELLKDLNFSKNYTVNVEVTEQQSVKSVIVEISFRLGKNNIEKVKMEKKKTKEVLDSPNKPILEENMVPVRYMGTELVKTNEYDSQWYDYSKGKWAQAVLGSDMDEIYIWVPNYAISTNSDIKFIFGSGERFVNDNGDLEVLPSNYEKKVDFGFNYGLWLKETDELTQEMISTLSNS